jgi:uncharacterized membrane protein SirB2
MIKLVHLTCVVLSLVSFVARVVIAETQPSLLKKKSFKIVPHLIDTVLLVSGIGLVFEGQWLEKDFIWLIAKLIAVFGYIGFGVLAMRVRGPVRWLALVAAMSCFVYIGIVAVTKNPWFFL